MSDDTSPPRPLPRGCVGITHANTPNPARVADAILILLYWPAPVPRLRGDVPASPPPAPQPHHPPRGRTRRPEDGLGDRPQARTPIPSQEPTNDPG